MPSVLVGHYHILMVKMIAVDGIIKYMVGCNRKVANW